MAGADQDAVLAAMMDDLGLDRMEDLANDDHRGLHGGPRHGLRVNIPRPELPTATEPAAHSWSMMYQNAVIQGVFNDDDAKGVHGLDSIDDGNLARRNRQAREAAETSRFGYPVQTEFTSRGFGRGRGRGGPKGGAILQREVARMMLRDTAYDPSNPNGRGRGRGRGNKNNLVPQPAPYLGQQVSPSGAVLPPGATVRRWDTHRKGQNNGPAASSAPSGSQIPQTPSNQPLSPQLCPKAPAPSPASALAETPSSSTNNILPPHLRPKPSTPSQASMLNQSSGSSTSSTQCVPPNLRPKAPALVPVASSNTPSAVPHLRGPSPTTNGAQHAEPSLPPYLRGPSVAGRATTPTMSTVAATVVQASPLPATTSAVTSNSEVPQVSELTVTKSDVDAQVQLQSEALRAAFAEHRCFYTNKIEMPYLHDDGELAYKEGLMSIYEDPERQTVIWELQIADGNLHQEDIRDLLPIFKNGSTIMIRRRSRPEETIRSSNVRFESIKRSQVFADLLNYHKKRLSSVQPKPKISPAPATSESVAMVAPVLSAPTSAPSMAAGPTSTTPTPDVSALPPATPMRSAPLMTVIDESRTLMEFSPEKLVDIHAPEPEYEPRSVPRTFADLEGLEYSSTGSYQPDAAELDEEDSAIAMSDTQHITSVSEAEDLLLDVALVTRMNPGVGLLRKSMAVLSRLRVADYDEMCSGSTNLISILQMSADNFVTAVNAKETTLQICLYHLFRDESFMKLTVGEMRKTLAVVFHNVRRMQEGSPIIYTPEHILELEQHAIPCNKDFSWLEDMISKGKKTNGSTISHKSPLPIPYRLESIVGRASKNDEWLYSTIPRTLDSVTSPNIGLAAASTTENKEGEDKKDWIPLHYEDNWDHSKAPNVRRGDASASEETTTKDESVEENVVLPPLAEITNVPPHLRGIGHSLGERGLGGSRFA